MNRFLLILSIFVFASFDIIAQTGGVGQIKEEAQFIIEKNRKITLPRAVRNFEKIPTLPVTEIEGRQQYQFKRFSYGLSPLEPYFKTINFRPNKPVMTFTPNYVKAGYGNFGTPYFEGYIGSKKSEDYVFNLYVRHLSSKKGPVFDENSGSGRTDAAIGGKFFNGVNTVSGSLDYRSRKVHFFGYNPVLDLTSDAIEQKFTRFSANVGIENTKKDEQFNYHFNTDWIFFRDNYTSKENKFDFDLGGDYQVSDNIKLSMGILAVLSKREENDIKTNRNYFSLQPRLIYSGTDFSLSAGVNFAGDNTPGSGASIYPAIKAELNVNAGLRLYAGYEGTLMMNTLESSVEQNPFLRSNVDLRNTEKKSDIYGGVEIDLSQGLRLNSGFSAASLNNLQLFTNAVSDSTRFEILYDPGTTDRLNIFSEVNYENEGLIRSSLRFDFYSYKLSTSVPTLAEAWHLPSFKTSFNNTFFPIENLTVTADLYYLGGLNALNGETAQVFELDDIIDLNLGGRYQVSQQFGVFLQMNNLFGTEYQRYLNYPSRGIQFLGGISISF